MQTWIATIKLADAGVSFSPRYRTLEEMKDAVMCLTEVPTGVRITSINIGLDKGDDKRG